MSGFHLILWLVGIVGSFWLGVAVGRRDTAAPPQGPADALRGEELPEQPLRLVDSPAAPLEPVEVMGKRKPEWPSFGAPRLIAYREHEYAGPISCCGCGQRLVLGEHFFEIPLPHQVDGAMLAVCMDCHRSDSVDL